MKRKDLLFILLIFVSIVSYSQEKKNNIGNKIVNKIVAVNKNEINDVKSLTSTVPNCWIKQFALIERWIGGMRPTASARALSYIHMAAYETALPGMKGYISNQEKIDGLLLPKFTGDVKKYNWNIALNACYAKIDSMFLINAGYRWNKTLTDLKDSLNKIYSVNISDEVFKNSTEWGLQIANAVWKYAITDIEANSQRMSPYPKNYILSADKGQWQGEQYGGFIPFTPYWGSVRTFTINAKDYVSPPPPLYSTDKESFYYKSNYEVYDNWKHMDSTKRWIAEFWSDDIVNLTFGPSTRMFTIAAQLVENEDYSLDQSLHLYCKLGIGLNDAMVACWKSKYTYNTERPWQYIRENIDPTFQSIMGQSVDQAGKNPPFPSYPSGHSTCAGVSEIILEEFFGENYAFTDRSHEGRKDFMGMPRKFNSINSMAEEDAYSRIPMGAHVRFDCEEGLKLGRKVGQQIKNYTLTKK